MKRLVHAVLRGISTVDYLARARLTLASWLVLGATVAAAITGVDTNQTVTYQAFAFLISVLLIALAMSLLFRPRVVAERRLPRLATAGQPVTYRVAVTNRGRRALRGATLVERFADPRPDYDEFARAHEPGEETRNWFDRRVGYFRWRYLIERRLPRPAAECPVPALAPGQSVEVEMTLLPRRRGRLEFAGLRLARTDPFGLLRGIARLPVPGKLIVLPKRYRVPALALPGKRRYQPGGVSLASSIGESEEFVSLRDYRPGDPLQRLHWKSFARTGRPIVKEYQDEFFERHALILDTGMEASDDRAFEAAVAVAASFVYTLDTQECLLDLMFVGGEVRSFTAGRGQMQPGQMLEVLAGVAPSPSGEFDALARAVLGRRAELTSAIVVLVGWNERRREFLDALRGTGLEVRGLLVGVFAPPPPGASGVVVLRPDEVEAGLARLQ